MPITTHTYQSPRNWPRPRDRKAEIVVKQFRDGDQGLVRTLGTVKARVEYWRLRLTESQGACCTSTLAPRYSWVATAVLGGRRYVLPYQQPPPGSGLGWHPLLEVVLSSYVDTSDKVACPCCGQHSGAASLQAWADSGSGTETAESKA